MPDAAELAEQLKQKALRRAEKLALAQEKKAAKDALKKKRYDRKF
jgi:hypothetical protein